MAITQDRMLALIAAAQFYQSSYVRLAGLISNSYSRAQKSPAEAQTTLTLLYGAAAGDLSERLIHDPVISREEYHFRKFRKRNDSTRRYAKGRRLLTNDGSTPKYTHKPIPQPAARSATLDRMIAKRDELEAQRIMAEAEERVKLLEATATPQGLGPNLVDSTPTDPSLVTKIKI